MRTSSKKKRQQRKENAVEKLKQAKSDLMNYIHIEIGHEYLLREFNCDTPKESNLEYLPKYVEKSLDSLESRVDQEQKENALLQKYIDMNISQESVSTALRAFSEVCQNVPVVYQREAAELLARTKISVYLDNYSYFPKAIRIVTEKISKVLKKYNLTISQT